VYLLLDQRDDRVVVTWPDGHSDGFLYLWLRDNCRCAECREPAAWERLHDTVAMPVGLSPASVVFDGGLSIRWRDGHRTWLSEGWLRKHAFRPPSDLAADCAEISWDSGIAAAPPQITLAEIDSGPAGLRRWLGLVRSYGFCLVRQVPAEVDAVIAVAERIAAVQPSNFGRSFHVISKPDPENLAYTAHRLHPHTDIPNRYSAANLQFLHCLQFGAQGGESILVDGFAAARKLAAAHPDAHRLLTDIPVRWRYQDQAVDIVNHFPVIRTDRAGRHLEIRFHTGLMEPLDLDPDLASSFYQALIAFGRLLRDPAAQVAFRMMPGDCQIFDNQRVLHGRASFDPSSGPRHLQGCYIDKDDFLGRLRALERDGNDFRRT
jgi:alpha-ketoglutarate-dependent taurine dioxygenase